MPGQVPPKKRRRAVAILDSDEDDAGTIDDSSSSEPELPLSNKRYNKMFSSESSSSESSDGSETDDDDEETATLGYEDSQMTADASQSQISPGISAMNTQPSSLHLINSQQLATQESQSLVSPPPSANHHLPPSSSRGKQTPPINKQQSGRETAGNVVVASDTRRRSPRSKKKSASPLSMTASTITTPSAKYKKDTKPARVSLSPELIAKKNGGANDFTYVIPRKSEANSTNSSTPVDSPVDVEVDQASKHKEKDEPLKAKKDASSSKENTIVIDVDSSPVTAVSKRPVQVDPRNSKSIEKVSDDCISKSDNLSVLASIACDEASHQKKTKTERIPQNTDQTIQQKLSSKEEPQRRTPSIHDNKTVLALSANATDARNADQEKLSPSHKTTEKPTKSKQNKASVKKTDNVDNTKSIDSSSSAKSGTTPKSKSQSKANAKAKAKAKSSRSKVSNTEPENSLAALPPPKETKSSSSTKTDATSITPTKAQKEEGKKKEPVKRKGKRKAAAKKTTSNTNTKKTKTEAIKDAPAKVENSSIAKSESPVGEPQTKKRKAKKETPKAQPAKATNTSDTTTATDASVPKTAKHQPVKRKGKRKVAQQSSTSSVQNDTSATLLETKSASKSPPSSVGQSTKASSSVNKIPPSSATKTTSSATAAAPVKAKRKKRNFQDNVLFHMLMTCKPFTLKSLAQELKTTEVALNFTMLSLIDRSQVVTKDFVGKKTTKTLYWANQESKSKEVMRILANPEDIQSAQKEVGRLQNEYSGLQKDLSVLSQEMGNHELTTRVETEEQCVSSLRTQVQAIRDRIKAKQQGQQLKRPPLSNRFGFQKPKSAAQLAREQCPHRMKIRINAMRDEWKKRKEKCADFIDQLADGMEKKPKDVIKLLDIDTDESEGAVMPPKYVVDIKK